MTLSRPHSFRWIWTGLALGSLLNLAWVANQYLTLRRSVRGVCEATQAYLQVGSYRYARDISRTALGASYADLDFVHRFANFAEHAEVAPWLHFPCRVQGRTDEVFEIGVTPTKAYVQKSELTFGGLLLALLCASWMLQSAFGNLVNVIVAEFSDTLMSTLGFSATPRFTFLSRMINDLPAVADGRSKVTALSSRLSEEMARGTRLTFELERRRKFSQYAHDLRSPLSALKILLARVQNRMSQDEVELSKSTLTRLAELPDLILADEKSSPSVKRPNAIVEMDEFLAFLELLKRRHTLAVKERAQIEWLQSGAGLGARLAFKVDLVDYDRILSNLIDNAVAVGASRVRIECSFRAEGAEICIADNGPGGLTIDPATNLPPVGQGLGFEIIRELVRRWSITVHSESPTGAGTRFTLFLPAAATLDH